MAMATGTLVEVMAMRMMLRGMMDGLALEPELVHGLGVVVEAVVEATDLLNLPRRRAMVIPIGSTSSRWHKADGHESEVGFSELYEFSKRSWKESDVMCDDRDR